MDFFYYFIKHCFICSPSDSTVSEDAGNEPRTIVTSTLAVRFVIFGGFFITKIGSPDISKIINKAHTKLVAKMVQATVFGEFCKFLH